jgi:hypothetical protein
VIVRRGLVTRGILAHGLAARHRFALDLARFARQCEPVVSDRPNLPPPGPTLSGLDTLWSGYDRSWKRLLSPGALTELRLRASFDVDLMAPWRIANKIPKGTIPDCASCDDICCAGVENVVSLRLRDIAVLLDLGREDLMTKQKPRFSEKVLRQRPNLRELVASELWRALPVLRQRGDHRICAALTPDLRCGLHPFWPTSCERFPYSLNAVRRQVTWGTRCPSQQQAPEHAARSDALFRGAVDAYNERIRDAVLLAHARDQLDAIGIGAWITDPEEDPFEPEDETSNALPIVD